MIGARQNWILFILALALMAGSAGALNQLKKLQRLGAPGLKNEAIAGKVNVQIALPARVLDYDSTNMPTAQMVLDYLPPDTSYAQRHYFNSNGYWAQANIILMGADRTSIHRPDYCLPGQGWQIRAKERLNLPIAGEKPYALPAGCWRVTKNVTLTDGREQPIVGLYVFWFVTEGQVTDDFPAMLKSMFYNLVRHGVQQRWAYVSYFTVCLPGQEDAALASMKDLITASVPQYQLPPAK